MSVVRLELAKGLGRHIRAGHPWVFRKALERPPKIPAGSVVDLTENGRFVARGYYDPLSAIAVRVLSRNERQSIDAAFFADRVKAAWMRRQQLVDFDGTDAFRLIHGEGDGLPGVVVDVYAGYGVIKLYSAGLNPYRSIIVEAMKAAVPSLKGVIGRDEVSRDDIEEDDTRGSGKMLYGEAAPELIRISEHHAKFLVDAYRGQKTGFFLDQRENRFLIRKLAKGRDVLNCFSFSGGFSVNAALGGANSVFSVDQDEDAVALSRDNFKENGLPAEKHDFLAADVFELLSSFKDEGRTFDLIILDPPAFAKSQRTASACRFSDA